MCPTSTRWVLQGASRGVKSTKFRKSVRRSQYLFKQVVKWSRRMVDNVVTLQTILGFNEPDQGEQHAMTPAEAAAEWMEIMARY